MGELSTGARPEEYVQATHQAFAACPRISGLQLVSVEVRDGVLTTRFEGPLGDFRGPYGVIVRLPATRQDQLWARYASEGEGTLENWAHAGVALRAVEAHAASRNQDRGYTTDNVWWLINDLSTSMAPQMGTFSSAAFLEPPPLVAEGTKHLQPLPA